MAITSLALHNISRASLLQDSRGNMELPAFRREGSNRHIKGCERASQQLKFEIRALDHKERERVAALSSLHDMESFSRALDEE
ncbi:hypothetical protein R1flu_001495 [Riccia fluitans]|uniref:Uncharacterized protein n=1 Tax=Riccia fluitans TaxID=41844 RepID=A0ABD1Y3W6_9MARC